LHRPELNDLVANAGSLATLSGTVVDLLQVLMEPTTCADEVARIVERDPAMTANVLKLGNSAFYGARQEVATVRQALVRLGNRCVATLGFAAGMAPVLRTPLKGYGLKRCDYWEMSLISAVASSEAVRLTTSAELVCEAFTAGLIHDVGMLILDPVLRQNQLVILADGDHADICRQELEHLGFDHCEAGAHLARKWGFPDLLADPAAHHHHGQGAGETADLVRAVTAGRIVAEALVFDPEAEVDESLTALGFSGDLLEQVRDALSADLESTLIRATRPQPQGVS
jgi:HD-like signal output (HDOD) protein